MRGENEMVRIVVVILLVVLMLAITGILLLPSILTHVTLGLAVKAAAIVTLQLREKL